MRKKLEDPKVDLHDPLKAIDFLRDTPESWALARDLARRDKLDLWLLCLLVCKTKRPAEGLPTFNYEGPHGDYMAASRLYQEALIHVDDDDRQRAYPVDGFIEWLEPRRVSPDPPLNREEMNPARQVTRVSDWIKEARREVLREAEEPQYVFKRDGDHWMVCCGSSDRMKQIKHSIGMQYVAELLKHPNEWIAVDKLEVDKPASKDNPDQDRDTSTRIIEESRQQLEIQVEQITALAKEGKYEEAEQDMRNLKKTAKIAGFIISPDGKVLPMKSRPRATEDAERRRKRVCNVIARALKTVKENVPAFFTIRIETGKDCRYVAGTEHPQWVVKM